MNAILDDLTLDERRELHARQKSLHCDIVGSLPLELVLEIARYLDPLEVWIFQRVRLLKRTCVSSQPKAATYRTL